MTRYLVTSPLDSEIPDPHDLLPAYTYSQNSKFAAFVNFLRYTDTHIACRDIAKMNFLT